jgi:hypothetical protein
MSRTLERKDLRDLRQRETEVSGAADEREDVQNIDGVDAITGLRPASGWKHASRLIEA